MSTIKLLVVEDDPGDINTCKSTVERYREDRLREVEIVECKDIDEAFEKLDQTFDGAIVDLRIGSDATAGNQVIQEIKERLCRFPVAILTGTPGSAEEGFPARWVFKKGDPGAGWEDLFDIFWKIQQTGLTRIIGGRGIIESSLLQVFSSNILPQIEKWERYGENDSARTEKALLRYTLNHLIQLMDEDIELYFPEEFYLYPPVGEKIRTGSILKEKETDKPFVVMSPDCDLVLRDNGMRNTDRILLVEVTPARDLFDWFDSTALEGLSNTRRSDLGNALRNNKSNYHHCLPATEFFQLGFLNFRYLSTVRQDEIGERFQLPPFVQISPPFVKDMVARFSSYFARQGQPDVDFSYFWGQ